MKQKPKFPVGTQVVVDPEGIAKPKYTYNPIKEIRLGEGGPKSISSFEGKVVGVELFEDGYRYNIKGGSGGVVTRYYIKEKYIHQKKIVDKSIEPEKKK